MNERDYMRRAITLAWQGAGWVNPNPMVGAVIVKDGRIIGESYHQRCGQLHAERNALATLTESAQGATMYVTLDGKIAAYTGASQWITGEKARAYVHSLRGKYNAIMAGIGTVLADDPMLNCRLEGAHQPVRIVVDSRLRIPLDSRVCQTAGELKTIVACAHRDEEKARALERLGVQVLCLPGPDGRVDLRALMEQLGKDKLDSVLIEGGGRLQGRQQGL